MALPLLLCSSLLLPASALPVLCPFSFLSDLFFHSAKIGLELTNFDLVPVKFFVQERNLSLCTFKLYIEASAEDKLTGFFSNKSYHTPKNRAEVIDSCPVVRLSPPCWYDEMLRYPSIRRQMRGRAGRKGKDTVGESYLCCPRVDKDAVKELLMARVKSSLTVGIQR
ncbi:hypothetical protein L211DRAFT_866078 [Terfezia boudieri ATCC MYA-4762]|uniref:Helicase C-terminal domain-containing protein n=1 Tax=Terfezia boudieri ATCC MYA-4762 TaxID=1051890 RepID=A0A3N4LWF0_9PEZI|nr:hypothetical protein L211DRAFT_866078 [Terfezia boudieri ATCC MYA-4762]